MQLVPSNALSVGDLLSQPLQGVSAILDQHLIVGERTPERRVSELGRRRLQSAFADHVVPTDWCSEGQVRSRSVVSMPA